MSGVLERFLLGRGERVVRVAPRLMADARRSSRERGKSDPIDALAVARAALREGVERLPAAFLDGRRGRSSCCSIITTISSRPAQGSGRLRWHLLDLECPVDLPTGWLDRHKWLDRLGRWLTRQAQGALCAWRGAGRQIRAQTRAVRELERELAGLVASYRARVARAAGLRAADRSEVDRRGRRHRTLQNRRPIRPRRRDRTDPRLLRTQRPVSPRPRRQPPTQFRASPHRRQRWPPRPPPAEYRARKQAEGKPAKPSAASNATSPAASTDSSPTPPGPLTSPRP